MQSYPRLFIAFILIAFIRFYSYSQTGISLPMIFQENKGQWDNEVAFRAVNSNSQIYFTKSKIFFSHSRSKNQKKDFEMDQLSWSMSFEGANKDVQIQGEGNSRAITNYLTGKTSDNLQKVKDYSGIVYEKLYSEIDLRYYSDNSNLKYDYILHPESDINSIRIKLSGIKKFSIKNEELLIEHDWGVIKEKKPYSYQIIDGKKKEVNISYKKVNNETFGFKITGEYDHTKDIILDPVTLIWGTYVGGTNASNGGYLYDLCLDADANVYATGYYPYTFPTTTNAYQKAYKGGEGDVFVFKLNALGNALIYATYIGGNDDDRGYGIAVNPQGEAFITGYTASASTSFPTTKTFGTAITGHNAFVCKLNADGSSLVYSAYFGGLSNDFGNGIEVDKEGNAYVVGETQSTNFPTTKDALNPTYLGGTSDGFILKLNPEGNALIYSTYIGGSLDDRARAIKLNNSGQAFVTGLTKSSNFKTTSFAYDKSHNGDYDAYVLKLNEKGDSLIYSTFLGGLGAEEGTSIDINPAGEAHITGYSYSPNYPITIPGPLKGLNDVILTKLDVSGSYMVYSRFIGGSQTDEGTSIIVTAKGIAVVAGVSKSTDFPIVDNGNVDLDPSRDKEYQVFAMFLDETGTTFKKSVKLGGAYDDYKIPSLAITNKFVICNVIIGFTSHSPDLRTTEGAFQPKKLNGDFANDQPAVFSLNFGPKPLPELKPVDLSYCPANANDELLFCAPANYDVDYPISYTWSNGSKDRCVVVPNKDLNPQLKLEYTNGCETKENTYKAKEYDLPKISIVKDKPTVCKGGSRKLETINNTDAYIGKYSIVWSTGEKDATSIAANQPGLYWVELKTDCQTVRDSIILTEIDKPLEGPSTSRTECFPGIYQLNGFVANDPNIRNYVWSTGEKTPTILVDSAGTYSLSVINECGVATSTHTIKGLTAPKINLGKDTSICQNTSIVLDAKSPLDQVRWSTGATTQTITVSNPGIYWVDVTNICGTTRDSITVGNSLTLPTVNLGPNQKNCNLSSQVLDATSSNAINYYWNTGETTPSITITKGGIYIVAVTNGCGTAKDTIEIIAKPSLNLELGPDQTACAPSTITLQTQNPGGKVKYLWSTGAITSSITISYTGKYWVRETNECGTASDTMNFILNTTKPIVSIGRDTSICPNKDFPLTAKSPGATYHWNTGEFTSSIKVNIAEKDTFWVVVANACGVMRDSIILSTIPPPVVNLGPDSSICTSKSIKLDAFNNNATYLWSTGSTASNITVSTSGIYYVDVTRCSTVRASVKITVNTAPPTVNLGLDKTICTDFSEVIDAGYHEGAKYQWSPGKETSQSITATKGNLYIVKVTNGCGSASDSLIIVGKPYTELGDDVSACKNDTLILDAGNQWNEASYLWNTNETTSTIKVHKSGVYSVVVTNVCGQTDDKISIAMDTVKCHVELGDDLRQCAPFSIVVDAENPGSKYKWSTGETTRTITLTQSGTYKVAVTNGCGITEDSISLTIDASAPHVDLGSKQKVCSPVNLLFDAGNENNFYKWYPNGQQTQTIGISQGGTYSVKVTNACGADSNGVEVEEFFPPTIDLGIDRAICATNVVLDAGNPDTKYFWSTGETTQKINVDTTGFYSVTVQNVCTIASKNVYLVLDKTIPIIELGNDTMFCTSNKMLLNVGKHPMATILWEPNGETSEQLLIKDAGTYKVTITNACGVNTDEIIINQNPVRVKAKPDTSICPGNKVQLSTIEDPMYTYSWSPAESLTKHDIFNPVASPNKTTKYYVIVSDGKCNNIDSALTVVHPLSHPEIHVNAIDGYTPLTINFTNPNPAASYAWSFGNGDSSKVQNPSYTYNNVGSYHVTLVTTTKNGCIESDMIDIKPFSLFIPNLITPNHDNKNDNFSLINEFVWLEVTIYNRWGQLIYKSDHYQNEWTGEGCADGVYYYYIKDKKYGKEFKGWLQLVRSSE